MSILVTIIIGLLVGVVAKLLMPGRDPGGFIITILLGIVGAVIATYVGRALGLYGPGEAAGFIGAVIGAILLLVIYRAIAGGRRRLL
jgi:uncharacterized membrane protein YeaQ/YmgE (transglycosylase-associated protein family)